MEKSQEKPKTDTEESSNSEQKHALEEMKEMKLDEAKKDMDDLFRSLILSKG